MANTYEPLCMNCMGLLDDNGVCTSCKAAQVPPNDPDCLQHHTMLDNHYHIGRVLRRNGESTVYLAYNTYTHAPVEVREYFPTTLSHRKGAQVTPNAGAEIQYKAILSDFIDLHRALMRLKTIPILIPVLDIFEANHTAYVVSQSFPAIRFGDFLNINAGELTWEQARGFLLPLLISIQHLHDANILHRGISPDTLLINKSGEIKLIDFCLPTVRTAKCELDPQLYSGYAAPEQYNIGSWQGTWTDVYAIAAVMYKTLTGAKPSDATARSEGEPLFAVSELNSTVPKQVSDILAEALAVAPASRIKTIGELQARLSSTQEGGEGGQTRRVVSREEVARAEAEAAAEAQAAAQAAAYDETLRRAKRSKRRRPHYGLLSGVLSTIILCSAVLYILYGMYQDRLHKDPGLSNSLSSVTSSEYRGTMKVPSFIGTDLDAARSDPQYNGKITFSLIYEANADYPEGQIFDQSPKAGETMEIGGVLNVKVSQGVTKVEMPDDIVGRKQADAVAKLEALKIEYEIIPVYETGFEKDVVTRTNFAPGTEITLGKDIVFLFVNQQEESSSSSSSSSGPPSLGPSL